MIEPEREGGHGHRTGVPWLDLTLGLSAVFISVMSLVVSINHGRTMEKLVAENERMVAANTMPFLQLSGSQYDAAGKPRLSLELTNGGIGPAVVDWLDLRLKGRPVTPSDVVRACCASLVKGQFPPGVFYANVSNSVLPAREKRDLLLATDVADPKVRAAIEALRPDLDARACYCSVLDECWITDFGPGRPRRVKDCKVPADVKPW